MIEAWGKGSIKMIIDNTGDITKHKSKRNESPSAFLARVLRTSKGLNGEAVWHYLKEDMNTPTIRYEECILYNKKTKKCIRPAFTKDCSNTKTIPCSRRRKECNCPKYVERKQKIMLAQEDISGLIFCQQNGDFYGKTVFTIKGVRLVTEKDANNKIKELQKGKC